MLAVPVAALVLAAGAPPQAAAQQAHRSIRQALRLELHALSHPASAEAKLFAADAVLLDARLTLLPYRYESRLSPLSDVSLAVVAEHVALARNGADRRRWIATTIARTRAAIRHLRPFR
jgi:hypothetical protein